MSTIQKIAFLTIMALAFASCNKDDDQVNLDDELRILLEDSSNGQGMSFFEQPESDDFNNIPQDPKNPLTAEKVSLGKMLYHETALGISPMKEIGKGTYSCASCHFSKAGFTAGRFQGISEGGIGFGVAGEGRVARADYEEKDLDVQPLRTPTTLNVAFQKNMLWNGQFGATGVNVGTESLWTPDTPIETNILGYEGVEIQAIAGLTVHRMGVDEVINDISEYKEMFDDAFAAVPENERYTTENAGLAIAAYERTLFPNQSPFQKYLKGNQGALTNQQKLGAMLFFGKAQCVECHTGPALNKMEFSALGALDLKDCGELTFKTPEIDPANLGRGSFTKNPEDNYKFKVPQLYNLKEARFFFHGSTFDDLKTIVEYKNNAIPQNAAVPVEKLDPLFKPLNLNQTEISQLTDFITNSLYDADLARYEPSSVLSGNCIPVNDPQSRIDLGCN